MQDATSTRVVLPSCNPPLYKAPPECRSAASLSEALQQQVGLFIARPDGAASLQGGKRSMKVRLNRREQLHGCCQLSHAPPAKTCREQQCGLNCST